MLNVLEFQKRAPRARGAESGPAQASPEADIAELASCVCAMQSMAKQEINQAVLMLDVAAQHAREIAKRMREPSARQKFDENISMIEQLLRLARQLALEL
jgi:hypothetical protein